MCIGLTFAASGYLIPQLEDQKDGFGISKDEGSWIASIMVLGCLTGSILGGFQSQKLGRKGSMMADAVIFIIATILLVFSPNLFSVLIARFAQGHAVSSSAVSVPLYTSETSQPSVRKVTGVFAVIFYCAGSTLSWILGASFQWRMAIGLFIVVPILSILILLLCPESPQWLLTNGKHDKAQIALNFLRRSSDLVEQEMAEMKKAMDQHKVINEGILDQIKFILHPSFYKPFAILLLVFPIGMSWSGLITIGFYKVSLLEDAKIPMNPYWAGTLIQIIRSIASIFGIVLNKKFGRREVYLNCCFLSCIGTSTLGLYYQFNDEEFLVNAGFGWVPIMCMILIYVAYGLGLGSIPIMLQVI